MIKNRILFLLVVFCSLGFGCTGAEEVVQWAVHLREGIDPGAIADESGAKLKGQIGVLKDYYIYDFSESEMTNESISEWLNKHPDVIWHKQQKPIKMRKRGVVGTPFDDPLYPRQWHLHNMGQVTGVPGTDINIMAAWDAGINGTGVVVGLVDEPVDWDHPDLINNILRDHAGNYTTADTFWPLHQDEYHGTATAGIIAAEDNEIGTVGVAYGSHIIPIVIMSSHEDPYVVSGLDLETTDAMTAQALSHEWENVDVYSNSWGLEQIQSLPREMELTHAAIEHSALNGRDGKGTVFVWAAGNAERDANECTFSNSRYTIPVSAVNDHGKRSYYSNWGSNMMVCAPSTDSPGAKFAGIVTTVTRDFWKGYEEYQDDEHDGYYSWMGGTSAACPMVAGVVSLMLQANPELSRRDVMQILAKTATRVDLDDPDWVRNAAGHWHNRKYGFGRVDAGGCVASALTWRGVEPEVALSTDVIGKDMFTVERIKSEWTDRYEVVVDVEEAIELEQVEVELIWNYHDDILYDSKGNYTAEWDGDITREEWRDGLSDSWNHGSAVLTVYLVSPAGTEYLIFKNYDVRDYSGEIKQKRLRSTQFLGESSKGQWKLRIDHVPGVDPVGTDIIYSVNFGRGYDAVIDRYPMDFFSGRLHFYGSHSKNEDPVANDDTFEAEHFPVSMAVLANDKDADGDSLMIISIRNPEGGDARLGNNGEIVFTPNHLFTGTDSVGYTISDGKGGCSHGVANIYDSRPRPKDDCVTTSIDKNVTIEVLENDDSFSSRGLAVVGLGKASHGKVEIVEGTKVRYTPNSGFVGTDRFTYEVGNGVTRSQSATVNVFVSGREDKALLFGAETGVRIPFRSSMAIRDGFTMESRILPRSAGEWGAPGYGRILHTEGVVVYLHGSGHDPMTAQDYAEIFPEFAEFYLEYGDNVRVLPKNCVAIHFAFPTSVGTVAYTPENSWTPGEWMDLRVSYDGKNLDVPVRAWINGQEVVVTLCQPEWMKELMTQFSGELSCAGAESVGWTGTMDFDIGWMSPSTGGVFSREAPQYRGFDGVIDCVRVWNVAKTYQNGQAWVDSSGQLDTVGLVGAWEFTEGMGLIVYDRSPIENWGSIIPGKVSWVPLDDELKGDVLSIDPYVNPFPHLTTDVIW